MARCGLWGAEQGQGAILIKLGSWGGVGSGLFSKKKITAGRGPPGGLTKKSRGLVAPCWRVPADSGLNAPLCTRGHLHPAPKWGPSKAKRHGACGSRLVVGRGQGCWWASRWLNHHPHGARGGLFVQGGPWRQAEVCQKCPKIGPSNTTLGPCTGLAVNIARGVGLLVG